MKSVIIVGGGVIGLFCAVRLAKAGARVTLLEAESEDVITGGPMASASAAGMLAPYAEPASPHDPLALQSLDLWRTFARGAAWEDGVRFVGGVELSPKPDALVARIKSAGRSASALNAGQFRKRTGFDAKRDDAVFWDDEGTADPIRVLTGLAMEARAHGVIVANDKDVMSAGPTSATTHDRETYEADHVVLAPGAWATEPLMAAAPVLKQVRAGKGCLAPVTLNASLGPNLHAPGFYLAQRRSDVVIGATLELDKYDRRFDAAGADALLAKAQAALPGEVTPAGRGWAGIRPMSPDGWPMIGPTGAGVLVAAGHSRNGWLLAPLTAEIITAYVFGAALPPAWAALAPQRFENGTA